ncbi:MAG: TetR family transcriptional regulator C-terminal domain-containing protein [Candidatus Desulfatibia sp.]|uniref:TetR/AcrR family transcriptional regulator n=1 Tax=Candidatus Desulfatibia sp. TaxID=3101189 RepID=UPI002F2BBB4B
MMKKTNSRDKIIEVGAQIIHRKGYNHTGIQEVLTAAGVPKGSFYFYFKNKEDFGLQIIDYFTEFYSQQANLVFDDQSVPPLERIKRFLEGFIKIFESIDFTCGCLIGNLAQEMGDLSPAFRIKLKESVDIMTDFYARALKEARQRDDISARLDIAETADFILTSWQGALVRMKIEQSARPLKNHIKFIFEFILES